MLAQNQCHILPNTVAMSFDRGISFTVLQSYVTDECVLCRRPRAQYWGNRNGWCLYCLQWYRRNGADWVIRCLNHAGKVGLKLQCESKAYFLPVQCRALVLDYLAGSTRALRAVKRREMWVRTLLGPAQNAYFSDSASDYSDDEKYFARKAAHVDTPFFWKLQFTWRSGENLIKSVVRFLV